MKSAGFNAVASPDARVLILGTLPSVRSLEQREYYAHARNSFWWIMGQLAGASPELAYEDRLGQLRKSGIALWDVCRSAERPGSRAANIRLPTVEPNDFRGQPAQRLFRAKVAPMLADLHPIPQRVLVSTSPACARVTRAEKLALWRDALAPFLGAVRWVS